MTGYQAAKLVNAALEAAGVEKTIPAQMMYNYLKKGYILKNEDGTVNEESLTEWLAKYLTKQGVTIEVSDPEQAAFDLAEAN